MCDGFWIWQQRAQRMSPLQEARVHAKAHPTRSGRTSWSARSCLMLVCAIAIMGIGVAVLWPSASTDAGKNGPQLYGEVNKAPGASIDAPWETHSSKSSAPCIFLSMFRMCSKHLCLTACLLTSRAQCMSSGLAPAQAQLHRTSQLEHKHGFKRVVKTCHCLPE